MHLMMFVPAAGAAEDAGEEGGHPATGGAQTRVTTRVVGVTTHRGTESWWWCWNVRELMSGMWYQYSDVRNLMSGSGSAGHEELSY